MAPKGPQCHRNCLKTYSLKRDEPSDSHCAGRASNRDAHSSLILKVHSEYSIIMRCHRLTCGSVPSCLILLLFTCSIPRCWASPLPTSSSSPALSSSLNHSNAVPAVSDLHLAEGLELLSKRGGPLSLDAGAGWTMNFSPFGTFLPIHSGALMLKELYQQAIAHAIRGKMSGLSTEYGVRIFLGALGTFVSNQLASILASTWTWLSLTIF